MVFCGEFGIYLVTLQLYWWSDTLSICGLFWISLVLGYSFYGYAAHCGVQHTVLWFCMSYCTHYLCQDGRSYHWSLSQLHHSRSTSWLTTQLVSISRVIPCFRALSSVTAQLSTDWQIVNEPFNTVSSTWSLLFKFRDGTNSLSRRKSWALLINNIYLSMQCNRGWFVYLSVVLVNTGSSTTWWFLWVVMYLFVLYAYCKFGTEFKSATVRSEFFYNLLFVQTLQ